MKRLNQKFFQGNTLKVARDLLGKFLIRKIGNKNIIGLITETEAYHGPSDLASHASRGRTPRTEVMFGPAGFAYVYLIYGMYYCLNIVTGPKNFPAAVLIRGIECGRWNNDKRYSTLDIQRSKIIGPGKICREFKINKNLNKENLLKSKKLFVIEDKKLLKKLYPLGFKIESDKRIGVDYAGRYKNKPWRFIFIAK